MADQEMSEREWRERDAAHARRVTPWIAPRLERRRQGLSHPVDDFLFDYYSYRPGQLARWHPGAGVLLTGDVSGFRDLRGYVVDDDGARVDPVSLPVDLLRSTLRLLEATGSRPASFGCFGRHEWAMVYRQSPDEIRHSAWPLRLPPADIARVVESSPLRCTHFDAFRFYTAEARPLNLVQPTRATQPELEQPGCLHATMDLYKWCFRSYPAVSADLTADCFALAREVRVVDMRASPYDFRTLGYSPIAIETPQGRAEYIEHQRDFAARGALLRECLAASLRSALGVSAVA
ncbi:MAG: hypothetical protein RL134_2270 [Actinomycetota bacterium]|jgi:hypothetical protein